jgi:hypothetical protein
MRIARDQDESPQALKIRVDVSSVRNTSAST